MNDLKAKGGISGDADCASAEQYSEGRNRCDEGGAIENECAGG